MNQECDRSRKKDIWKNEISTGYKVWFYISCIIALALTVFLFLAGLNCYVLLIPGVLFLGVTIFTIIKKNFISAILMVVFYFMAQVTSMLYIIVILKDQTMNTNILGPSLMAAVLFSGAYKVSYEYEKKCKAMKTQVINENRMEQ